MWLSGLHIPESYLTAMVQATCRKNGWPLDRSTLYTQVTQHCSPDEVNERPGQGMRTHKPADSHTVSFHKLSSKSHSWVTNIHIHMDEIKIYKQTFGSLVSSQVALCLDYTLKEQTGTRRRAV